MTFEKAGQSHDVHLFAVAPFDGKYLSVGNSNVCIF